ncbi:hypothetical protein [Bradyrhizobium sp. CCBAU 51753]|uniref:hypothetical protein n=1 Tax=Bradyrhizobium sp. CCBAU 51753 TaxID=1325100 RepID=UPI00188D4AA6|nr:hypothetical protein [Bradyrhizobium sp. CCBAU 51753]
MIDFWIKWRAPGFPNSFYRRLAVDLGTINIGVPFEMLDYIFQQTIELRPRWLEVSFDDHRPHNFAMAVNLDGYPLLQDVRMLQHDSLPGFNALPSSRDHISTRQSPLPDLAFQSLR